MISSYIKKFFPGKDPVWKKRLRELKKMEPGHVQKQLAFILYDECLRSAAKFVHVEIKREDSPFKGLTEYSLFHEIMIINFWIVDKVFSGKKRDLLMNEIYNAYNNSYFPSYGHAQAVDFNSLSAIFKKYYSAWDELSGHQDNFGVKAGERICESNNIKAPSYQISFWMISYADDTMKTFEKIRTTCGEMNITG